MLAHKVAKPWGSQLSLPDSLRLCRSLSKLPRFPSSLKLLRNRQATHATQTESVHVYVQSAVRNAFRYVTWIISYLQFNRAIGLQETILVLNHYFLLLLLTPLELLIECHKTKTKWSLYSIREDTQSSEPIKTRISCSWRKARENACKRATIGLVFLWLDEVAGIFSAQSCNVVDAKPIFHVT